MSLIRIYTEPTGRAKKKKNTDTQIREESAVVSASKSVWPPHPQCTLSSVWPPHPPNVLQSLINERWEARGETFDWQKEPIIDAPRTQNTSRRSLSPSVRESGGRVEAASGCIDLSVHGRSSKGRDPNQPRLFTRQHHISDLKSPSFLPFLLEFWR